MLHIAQRYGSEQMGLSWAEIERKTRIKAATANGRTRQNAK